MSAGFAAHAGIRHLSGLSPTGDALLLSYGVNFVLAFAILAILYGLRFRARNQLGFLFIAGSLLKFAAFFLLLYPGFRADDHLARSEFLSFFVPYATALVLETYFAAALLRKLENGETS